MVILTLYDILHERAEQAVVEHTRLVLLAVIHVLDQSESKEQAIANIAEFLQRYGK